MSLHDEHVYAWRLARARQRMTRSLLDSNFRYTSSAGTDVRKTFARVRREQRREQVHAQAPTAPLLLFHRKEVQR